MSFTGSPSRDYPGQFRPLNERETRRHLLALDLAVAVLVELVNGCLPCGGCVQLIISTPAERRAAGKTATRRPPPAHRRFLPGNRPPTRSLRRGRVVGGQPSGSQNDQFLCRAVAEDHGRGPTSFEQRTRLFPGRFPGVRAQGQKPRPAVIAVLNQDDGVAVESGRRCHPVLALRGVESALPQPDSGMVVTNKSLSSEIDVNPLGRRRQV